MTRRCSVGALVLLLGAACFGAEQERWVLAARPFTLAQQSAPSDSAEHLASVLPQLLLEQVALGGTRVLPGRELLDRRLDALQTERLSLFLQLSREYQARDALVLAQGSPRKLARALGQAQEKIDGIQRQIDANLAEAERAREEFRPVIERDEAAARGEEVAPERRRGRWLSFFSGGDGPRRDEAVAVYRDDSTALFMPSESALAEGVAGRAYEREVAGAGISGVLSGSISGYGDYLAVSVDLHVYPGARLAGSVTEVGTVGDQMDLAERIARRLAPVIANSLPVILRFEVSPPEAAASASLTLDGLVYSSLPESLQADAAVHTMSVAAPGYETATFTYKYEGNEQYRIAVALRPATEGVLSLRLKTARDGIFYPRGFERQEVDGERAAARVSVNGKAVLGVFAAGGGAEAERAFFYLPGDLAQDGADLMVDAVPFDRAANVDKRRRRMYTAYSALICSLPFTFYCVGNFTAANNAYMRGRVPYDEAKKWQTRGYVASGISIACGAWAVFELVRYLWAANQVLPAQARADGRGFPVPGAEDDSAMADTAGTAEGAS